MIYPTFFQSIKVSGRDAETFLQGQLSNDVNLNGWNAYCTPKGEVIAIFALIKAHDAWYLCSQDENLSAALKRLSMFVLRSDVTFTPLTSKVCLTSQPHDHPLSFAINDLWHLVCCETDPEFTQGQTTEAAQKQLMDLGLVRLNAQSSGQYVPQFLNLDALKALDWKKGCYVGQEVIARLHYRGQASKNCFKLTGLTQPLPLHEPLSFKTPDQKPFRSTLLNQCEDQAMALGSIRNRPDQVQLDDQQLSIHELTP